MKGHLGITLPPTSDLTKLEGMVMDFFIILIDFFLLFCELLQIMSRLVMDYNSLFLKLV